jgi:hypothetical protein
MRHSRLYLTLALPLALSTAAFAGQVNGSVGVGGHVQNYSCTLGTVSPQDGIFDMGVLVDPVTGYLRPNLTAAQKTLSGSICTTRSTISVVATRMQAASFSGVAPGGFSEAVDYTASVSGWTTAPASYSTGSSSNPAASQTRPTAYSGDISISLSNFTTTGGNTLRLVSDPLYQGVVTITLSVAS